MAESSVNSSVIGDNSDVNGDNNLESDGDNEEDEYAYVDSISSSYDCEIIPGPSAKKPKVA